MFSQAIFAQNSDKAGQCLKKAKEHVDNGMQLLLDNCGLEAKDMPTIVAYLNQNPNYFYVDLDNNNIGDEGVKLLAPINSITELLIDNNNISDIGAADIAQSKSITRLDIGINPIGDAGAKALAQNKVLTSLSFYRDSITDVGAAALGKSTIKILFLDYNNIGSNGAVALAQNNALEVLTLFNNHIGDQGASALANLPNLFWLEADNNQIGDVGTVALSQGLSSMKTGFNAVYAHLTLEDNNITDVGAYALAGANFNPWVRLDVNNNQLTSAGIEALKNKYKNVCATNEDCVDPNTKMKTAIADKKKHLHHIIVK